MAKSDTLTPAAELARATTVRIPNESAEYRAARTALLAEEIELRRHIERVAAQRRALPPGGPVTGDYRFEGPFRPRVRAHGWGYRRRRHPLLRFLVLVAIVWAVARLVRGRRYSGWF